MAFPEHLPMAGCNIYREPNLYSQAQQVYFPIFLD